MGVLGVCGLRNMFLNVMRVGLICLSGNVMCLCRVIGVVWWLILIVRSCILRVIV